ncbi:uncharacterized protein K02A2.6-like [Eupeodes corollae]|uniref:uncharacterized protein K02A2.6-like n=1 Tax=Eupeodes corollae TaxID=290404 RepID=UPI0024910D3F|nr:uncharacterized protein K02A2.6-like [Eupeodes corollae]
MFAKIDLSDAYLQIELDDESKEMAVINTPFGLYQYQLLPFGISSAPGEFQNIMEQLFADLPVQYIWITSLFRVAGPLNALRAKDAEFVWSACQQNAMDTLKNSILQAAGLAHFDDSLSLILSTDASSYGIGAVISHRYPDGTERPIAFASKTLDKHQKLYSQIEKEALSIFPFVVSISAITSEAIIKAIQSKFAIEGLPKMIVADNGTQFTAQIFKEFSEYHSIQHYRTASFHPASNGEAEKFVRTFKESFKKNMVDKKDSHKAINTFLATYPSTPNGD